MSLLGAVVVAGAAPLTARTLDSLVRQSSAFDSVVVVGGPGLDPRVGAWLEATASARAWSFVPKSGNSLGARVNAGLAAAGTDWFVVIEAGDVLLTTAAAAINSAVSGSDPGDFVAGAARVVGLGVDETASVGAPDDLAAFDPAHPALRSVVWRSRAVHAAGGFDSELAAAVRYDMWLRLLARGGRGLALPETLVRVSVAEGEPLPAELASPGYRDAVSRRQPAACRYARRPSGRCARSTRQACHDARSATSSSVRSTPSCRGRARSRATEP